MSERKKPRAPTRRRWGDLDEETFKRALREQKAEEKANRLRDKDGNPVVVVFPGDK